MNYERQEIEKDMMSEKWFIESTVNYFYNYFKKDKKFNYSTFTITFSKTRSEKENNLPENDFIYSMTKNNPTIIILLESNDIIIAYGKDTPTERKEQYSKDEDFFIAQLMYKQKLYEPFEIKNKEHFSYDTTRYKDKSKNDSQVIGVASLFSIHKSMMFNISLENIEREIKKYFVYDENSYERFENIFKSERHKKSFKIVKIFIGEWS